MSYGAMEMPSLWSQYADYLVGSEEVEAGSVWDYSFWQHSMRQMILGPNATAASMPMGSTQDASTENFNPDAPLYLISQRSTGLPVRWMTLQTL